MAELMIAMIVTLVSAGVMSSTLVLSKSMSGGSTERRAALDAVQSVIESMRAQDPTEVFARFNATVLDDPPNGLSPGNTFAVPSLRAARNDPDGIVGEVLFPGDGVQLREDVDDPALGMRRDLNGDENIDALDHAGDYTILPVRVRARWQGAGGVQTVEVVFITSTR